MLKKLLALLLAAAMCFALLAGCSDGSDRANDPDDKYEEEDRDDKDRDDEDDDDDGEKGSISDLIDIFNGNSSKDEPVEKGNGKPDVPADDTEDVPADDGGLDVGVGTNTPAIDSATAGGEAEADISDRFEDPFMQVSLFTVDWDEFDGFGDMDYIEYEMAMNSEYYQVPGINYIYPGITEDGTTIACGVDETYYYRIHPMYDLTMDEYDMLMYGDVDVVSYTDVGINTYEWDTMFETAEFCFYEAGEYTLTFRVRGIWLRA